MQAGIIRRVGKQEVVEGIRQRGERENREKAGSGSDQGPP